MMTTDTTPTRTRSGSLVDDWGSVWLPMTSMSEFARHGRTIVRGEGSHVYDEDGRRYLSATSGLWNVNCGWGHPRIIAAIHDQLTTLSYATLFRYGNDVAVELANRLLDIAPGSFDKVFYSCSGSAAVETTLKAARRYQRLLGHPERDIVVGLRGSYHGTMYGSMALTGDDLEQDEYGVDRRSVRHVQPGVEGQCPGCAGHCPRGCGDELAELFEREGERIAAVVLEPVLGSGGYVVTRAFASLAARLCAEHGALLVIDEVATGFGRTGAWFATERLEVQPDALILSKAINSGYLPLAVTLFGARVVEAFASSGATFAHGETQAGNPAACAAALATIDVLESEGLVEHGAAMGERLHAGLTRLGTQRLGVRAVRGRGLMLGVELESAGGGTMRPHEVLETVEVMLGEGVIVHPGPGGIGLLPPLVITPDEIDSILDALGRVLAGGGR
jgi:adenosylmethionine-8-amino-7-oxononanoate aminotransferase